MHTLQPSSNSDAIVLEARARQSLGLSNDAIYRLVAATIDVCHTGGGTLLDVGCGTGSLWKYVSSRFDRYVGVDAVRYEAFPKDFEFCYADLDRDSIPLECATADVVVAVETIEHLENPRAFARELTRLVKPGGWVLVTTPNQLSWLSKLTLILKNCFGAFQDSCYPAHITALLEIDLRRIAVESGLKDVMVKYSEQGRVPGMPWHYPRTLSHCSPRAFSDNVLVAGRKPLDSMQLRESA